MTTISNLPNELLEEILSRVQISSIRAMRSTCKLWNKLLRDPSPMLFDKASKEIMFIFIYDIRRLCLLNVDKDLGYPYMKKIGEFKQVEIHGLLHCSGLLLCLTHCGNLIVWNPYLGHTRWITDGYSTGKKYYSMGYDINNNHKILKVSYWTNHIRCEIYDFKYSSWRVLGIKMDWIIYGHHVSLKGNSYYIENPSRSFVICFDFTREIFWGLPPLPCDSGSVNLDALYVVSEEKLAVLCRSRRFGRFEIWITNKIESNAVSWSLFIKIDDLPYKFYNEYVHFFVDEKEKVAMICDTDFTARSYQACMVGESGHYRETPTCNRDSSMCSIYVPSLRWIE